MKTGVFVRLFSFVSLPAVVLISILPLKAGGESAPATFFARAAEQNSFLKNELRWTFGGKNQRGWGLYTALISQTIDARSEPDSAEFALALSRWQKKNGLPQHGILDHQTWMKMISLFQARRFSGRGSTVEMVLETVPASSFYHQERPEELRRVERQALAAYRRMLAAAERELALSSQPSGGWLKIISAYRSPAYQAQLRRRSPSAGRAGLAINSPHFTGRALDLFVGGEPVSTKDQNRAIQVQTRAYRWLVENAGRFGFAPYFYEPWHWEFTGV